MRTDAKAVREAFRASAAAFVELVCCADTAVMDRQALGVWTVRDLVGHASRALTTVETYLGKAAAGATLDGPVDYVLAARAALADPEAVAQRGRDAGAAFGDDPGLRVAELVERVTALVDGSADDTPVGTPIGTMTLAAYLPTRTFELTVHSLDLARALDADPPSGLATGIAAACELAGRLAAFSTDPAAFLLAATGRAGLPPGFTVL